MDFASGVTLIHSNLYTESKQLNARAPLDLYLRSGKGIVVTSLMI